MVDHVHTRLVAYGQKGRQIVSIISVAKPAKEPMNVLKRWVPNPPAKTFDGQRLVKGVIRTPNIVIARE